MFLSEETLEQVKLELLQMVCPSLAYAGATIHYGCADCSNDCTGTCEDGCKGSCWGSCDRTHD